MLFIVLGNFAFAELHYEDVSSDSWAYTSIKSLVDKGIILQDSFKFDGNKPMTRYDFAVDMARALNYINLNKANKEDLNILESLMLEFSNELNRIGFDASTFNDRINNADTSIEMLKKRVENNEILIKDLQKQVQELQNNEM